MKTRYKVVLGLLAVLLILVSCYLYLIWPLINAGPRKPKLELPVTYRVGWWPYQSTMHISAFNVTVVESKLSMFNPESLLAYTVKGELEKPSGRVYSEVTEVHVSERINTDSSLNCDVIVEITPIVTQTQMSSTDRRSFGNGFFFTNEILIHSAHSGVNRIMFVCEGRQRIVELTQGK